MFTRNVADIHEEVQVNFYKDKTIYCEKVARDIFSQVMCFS